MAGTARKKPQEPLNLETLMGNKPPQALDVEEAVLGAMLVEPATIDESMEELSAGCFYDPRHRKIFEAMSALVNEHVSIDIVTVSEKLRSRGDLEEIGGPVELARLSQNIGAAAHIEYGGHHEHKADYTGHGGRSDADGIEGAGAGCRGVAAAGGVLDVDGRQHEHEADHD